MRRSYSEVYDFSIREPEPFFGDRPRTPSAGRGNGAGCWSADCPPSQAHAELIEGRNFDPSILHTSGTTSRPKSVVRDNSGHAAALI